MQRGAGLWRKEKLRFVSLELRMKRGTHPNSIAALAAHKRKPGDPPLPNAGRPRQPLTDRAEALLEQRLTATKDGRALREKLGLHRKATWADALTAQQIRRAVEHQETFADLRNAIEGSPVQRQHIEEKTSGRLILHVMYDVSCSADCPMRNLPKEERMADPLQHVECCPVRTDGTEHSEGRYSQR